MNLKIVSIAFVMTLAAFAATAQAAAIDRAATSMAGKEAQFTHRFTPKGFKTSQVEKGTVIFGSLPMMRWNYTAPEQKLFVFDGTRSWFYVPADRQVTVADLDDRRRSELPFLVLGQAAARAKEFTVKEQKRGAKVVTTLQPRNTAAAIRTVTITTNAANLIESLDYTDKDGNRTVFEFSGYHPARTSAETFRFNAPAGVQIVRAD